MVDESILGVSRVLFYSVMSLVWILLLVGIYYRRDELSQRKLYAILGGGIVWSVYFLFNLNHVALSTVPMAATLGIDVLLGIMFLAGCYVFIKSLSADAK